MILVFKKKRVLAVVVLLVLTACLMGVFFSPKVASTLAAKKKLPIYSVETTEKVVALTFDAAWGADKTDKIMDILDEYGMKGTFFLVGFWIDAYPEKVKEINQRGFLIGNHSTNHPHFNSLSSGQIASEISVTNMKLKQLTDNDTVYFRAPFGEYDNRLLDYIENNGMQCIQWDIDTLDWKGLSGGEIANRVLSKVREGSIILCHNNADHIVEALPIILTGLKNKGYKSVRLDELVLKESYRIDNNGRQIAE